MPTSQRALTVFALALQLTEHHEGTIKCMTDAFTQKLWNELTQDATEMLAEYPGNRYPGNRVDMPPIDPIFTDPLWGVAASEDPVFLRFQDESVIGSHYRLPEQWLPGARTVISYFLPFSPDIRWANAAPGEPAEEWLYGRYEGEQVNDALRHWLVERIEQLGYKATVPSFSPEYSIHENKANWSERHTAFVAGLGTFGMHSSFITALGCAGRFGSVITTAPFPPVTRPYEKPNQYCRRCGLCIKRCPVGAISRKGKDHAICAAYLGKIHEKHHPRYGCGKCQTAVPCEWGIPK